MVEEKPSYSCQTGTRTVVTGHLTADIKPKRVAELGSNIKA